MGPRNVFGSRGVRRRSRASMLASILGALLMIPMFPPAAHAAGELAAYVARPDDSYRWEVVNTGPFASGEYIEIVFTSQTWRSVPWQHNLFIFRPGNVDTGSQQGFLYIAGGRWNPEARRNGRLPSEAYIFARLAEALRAPVAVVRQVPFQPLFDRREDALIAYTFDQYLQTGDPEWPLLLPMVKTVVRAMDVVQEVSQKRWNLDCARFTLSGASKRGWTSWLTAASDPRVASVAPMVIDMLNLPEQIRLQRDTFGELSAEVRDYTDIQLPERLDSERGRALLEMVDPYHYRASLDMPKLVLLGTNDPYWPLDALSLYWRDLLEPKRVLYLPNQGHDLADFDRLIGSLSALHRYSSRSEALPALTWDFETASDRLMLNATSSREPATLVAWTASSATRDFRKARWSRQACEKTATHYSCSRPARPGEFTALYAEATFRDPGEREFFLSTSTCIIDASGRMVRECTDNLPAAAAPPSSAHATE